MPELSESLLETALKEAKRVLREAGIASWALDSDLLMCYLLSIGREQLITRAKYLLSPVEVERFRTTVEKRRNLMPVSYITNHAEFMGLDFYVDENVLIPRPDTETLVEAAISYINESGARTVLDMCTGSGAIGVSIARCCPNVNVTAADISPEALKIAAANAESNRVSVSCIESNMFEKITGAFDVIVSNPPYISGDEMSALPDNVSKYEPHTALYGGEDGLAFYRILAKGGKYLSPKGKIFAEIGAGQKSSVTDIFIKKSFYLHSALKDLAGLDRTLIFGKNR